MWKTPDETWTGLESIDPTPVPPDSRGFACSFVRGVVGLPAFFRELFTRSYGRRYYVGEWHSHPSFDVRPSGTDAETMRRLVRDPEFRGIFAVLMIVRLDGGTLTMGAWLFDPPGAERAITLAR